MGRFREALHNFQKPVTFPQDEEKQAKTGKHETTILGGLIDQSDPVSLSYPSLLLLIKMMASSKCAKSPKCHFSSVSAQQPIPDGTRGEIHRETSGKDPDEDDYDLQHVSDRFAFNLFLPVHFRSCGIIQESVCLLDESVAFDKPQPSLLHVGIVCLPSGIGGFGRPLPSLRSTHKAFVDVF